MATKPKSDAELLQQMIQTEIPRIGQAVSVRLFDNPPGQKRLTEPQYLNYVLRHWPDPEFRHQLLIKVGEKNFVTTWERLGERVEEMIANEEPWPETWRAPAAPSPAGGPMAEPMPAPEGMVPPMPAEPMPEEMMPPNPQGGMTPPNPQGGMTPPMPAMGGPTAEDAPVGPLMMGFMEGMPVG